MSNSLPIELVEHFQRGNGLIFLGDRVVRDVQGQVLVRMPAAELRLIGVQSSIGCFPKV